MIIVTYLKSTGDIVSYLLSATEEEFANVPNEFGRMFADIPFGATNYFVKNGKIVEREPKPSYEYIWDGNAWVIDEVYAGQKIRLERNELLLQSDWTDTLSAQSRLGETKYAEWQSYRQDLRDITSQSGFPENVVWPTKPE